MKGKDYMAEDICPKCGLPKDLCVCEEIGKEEQRIRIRIEKRKWGREVTIIDGLDDKELNLSDLTSRLKAKCACGGTFRKNHIELQGDHRQKAKELLIGWGFTKQNIDVQ